MGSSKDLQAVGVWIRDGLLPQPADAAEARELAKTAALQGLAAWLDEALPSGAPQWPADLRADLRRAHLRVHAETVRRLDLARRVQQQLDAAGIRSLVLKGAALVETYYPSPAHRPMSDVDVLALDRPREARSLLIEAGFRESAGGDHAWVLEDPAGAGTVELHHSVTSCPGLFAIDADEWWRARVDTPGGLHAPSAELLIVQLALHAAFQHGLALSLIQYLDFRRVLEGPIDVDRTLRLADRAGAREALSMALHAAAAVVGAPRPGTFAATHPPAWLARRLRDPMGLLDSENPPLLLARWTCARGRRWDLMRLSLAGPAVAPATTTSRRWRMRLGRAWGLARWALRSAR